MELLEKSLNEIYGRTAQEPETDSYVIRTALQAMQTPLKNLAAEEIRLLIGQKIGLRELLPSAVKILRDDPLTEACLYPGDLLCTVLRLQPDDWAENPADLRDFQALTAAHEAKIRACADIPDTLLDAFMHPTEFQTPCGILRLTDAAGSLLPLPITQEIWPQRAGIYDIIAGTRVPVSTPHQYTVAIKTAALEIGKNYVLRLCGDYAYSYGDSDERAIANAVTVGNITLSLGAQDLNDDEKDRQAVPNIKEGVQIGWKFPEQFDESKFRSYALFVLPDWSGYRFRLLDRSQEEIRFRLAWLRHAVKYAEADDYAAAVTLWTII